MMTITGNKPVLQPSFSGKVALIAGAGRWIGAVTAQVFARAGAAVVPPGSMRRLSIGSPRAFALKAGSRHDDEDAPAEARD